MTIRGNANIEAP
ncbi:unnamed protein product, partial [Rotaria sp. Silwood1]